jgi:release factor glutamine methyltransferase
LDKESFYLKTTDEFDIIVSNPPYINESEKLLILKNVIEHEPHLALFVNSDDAILFYRKIVDICLTKLNRGGKLYFELNPLTAEKVLDYAIQSKQFKSVELIKDMSGNTRFLEAYK